MMNALLGIGYGIVGLGVLVVIGTVIVTNLGNSTGGTANTNAVYVAGQLGQSGLAGWIPTVIALSIGLLALGSFIVGKGDSSRY